MIKLFFFFFIRYIIIENKGLRYFIIYFKEYKDFFFLTYHELDDKTVYFLFFIPLPFINLSFSVQKVAAIS